MRKALFFLVAGLLTAGIANAAALNVFEYTSQPYSNGNSGYGAAKKAVETLRDMGIGVSKWEGVSADGQYYFKINYIASDSLKIRTYDSLAIPEFRELKARLGNEKARIIEEGVEYRLSTAENTRFITVIEEAIPLQGFFSYRGSTRDGNSADSVVNGIIAKMEKAGINVVGRDIFTTNYTLNRKSFFIDCILPWDVAVKTLGNDAFRFRSDAQYTMERKLKTLEGSGAIVLESRTYARFPEGFSYFITCITKKV